MRCFYDVMPVFLRSSFYAPGCLAAINLALYIGPVFWLAATIWLDWYRNRIKPKNVYLNEVIDKDSGHLKNKKTLFKDNLEDDSKNKELDSEKKEDSSDEKELNGLTEQIILAA